MSTFRSLPSATMTPDDLKSLRILVVDDHSSTLRLVSDVMRAGGVGQVFTASDGRHGLDTLTMRHPHIIFTDWNMPGMDGLEFTRTIRRAALRPNVQVPDPRVPIVMLTGQRSQREVEVARRAGVNEFVIKPFTPAALLGRIQAVLTRPREFVISAAYVGPDRRRRTELNYTGPMRRLNDAEMVADAVERDLSRNTISVELDALRQLISSRGGVDRVTLQMTYRVMQHTQHRARQVRDTMIERAAASLTTYTEAVGGPALVDPEVVEIHLDAIRSLLAFSEAEAEAAQMVVRQLERVVERKLAARMAA